MRAEDAPGVLAGEQRAFGTKGSALEKVSLCRGSDFDFIFQAVV